MKAIDLIPAFKGKTKDFKKLVDKLKSVKVYEGK
jgi:hypothetical protein